MQLLFDDPHLAGLYEFDCPSNARLRCTATVRKHFARVLNCLVNMQTQRDIFSYQSLDCQTVDARRSLLSVKITTGYRLELSCQEQDGLLVCVTVHALRSSSYISPSR